MPDPSAPTDEHLDVEWRKRRQGDEQQALHLVVAFWLDEPERVGQVAPIDRWCFLGRGAPGPGEGEMVAFFRHRPGEIARAPEVTSTKISRRQLVFRRVSRTEVGVECVAACCCTTGVRSRMPSPLRATR